MSPSEAPSPFPFPVDDCVKKPAEPIGLSCHAPKPVPPFDPFVQPPLYAESAAVSLAGPAAWSDERERTHNATMDDTCFIV